MSYNSSEPGYDEYGNPVDQEAQAQQQAAQNWQDTAASRATAESMQRSDPDIGYQYNWNPANPTAPISPVGPTRAEDIATHVPDPNATLAVAQGHVPEQGGPPRDTWSREAGLGGNLATPAWQEAGRLGQTISGGPAAATDVGSWLQQQARATGQAIENRDYGRAALEAGNAVAGGLGRGLEASRQSWGEPIQGQFLRGTNAIEQRIGDWGAHRIDDPLYQSLLETNPAAAARYYNERNPVAGFGAEMAFNPVNYLGTGGPTALARGLETAAIRAGTPEAVQAGAQLLTQGVRGLEGFVNLPAKPIEAAVTGVGRALRGPESRAGLEGARIADELSTAPQSLVNQRLGVQTEQAMEEMPPAQAGRQAWAERQATPAGQGAASPFTPGTTTDEIFGPAQTAAPGAFMHPNLDTALQANTRDFQGLVTATQRDVVDHAARTGWPEGLDKQVLANLNDAIVNHPEAQPIRDAQSRFREALAANNGRYDNGVQSLLDDYTSRARNFFQSTYSQTLRDMVGQADRQVGTAGTVTALPPTVPLSTSLPQAPSWVQQNQAQLRDILSGTPVGQALRDAVIHLSSTTSQTAAQVARSLDPQTVAMARQLSPDAGLAGAVRDIRNAYGIPSAGSVGPSTPAADLAERAAYEQAYRQAIASGASRVDAAASAARSQGTAVPGTAGRVPPDTGPATLDYQGNPLTPESPVAPPWGPSPTGPAASAVGHGPPPGAHPAEVLSNPVTTPAAAQQATATITRDLTDHVPTAQLTDAQNRILDNMTQGPWAERTMQAAQRAAADVERLQNMAGSQLPSDHMQLARELTTRGVTRIEDLPTPAAAAVGAHIRQMAEALGVKPPNMNPGAWERTTNAAAQLNNEWKAAVLSSPLGPTGSWHVGNVLSIGGASAQMGVRPFTGDAVRQLERIGGLAGVEQQLAATMGLRGLNHDFFATQGLANVARSGAIRGTVEMFQEEIGRALHDPNMLGAVTRIPGVFKAGNFAVAGAIETNARLAAYIQGYQRSWQQGALELARAMRGLPDVQRALLQGQMTPQGVMQALGGVRSPALAERLATLQRQSQQAGLGLVSKIHFNYSERDMLTQNAFMKAVVPFSKWAIGNLGFYGQMMVSRPALWSTLSAYDRMAQRDPELQGALPGRLNGYVNIENVLPGGWGRAIANAAFGNPLTQGFINPINRIIAAKGQIRDPFYGEGATGVGKALATAQGMSGLSINPVVDIPMKAFGVMGNVPINAPVGVRNAPGAAFQGAYGAATGGRSYEQDFNRAVRDIPGGLNQRFNEPDRVQSGLGPIEDMNRQSRIIEDATRRGELPSSPAVIASRTNPNSPGYQQAAGELRNEQINPWGQALQSSLQMRGVQPERLAYNQARQTVQDLESRGVPFQAAARTVGPPGSEYYNLNAPVSYLQQQAAYQQQGLVAPRSQLETSPYPGNNAPRDQLDAYYNTHFREQQARAAEMAGQANVHYQNEAARHDLQQGRSEQFANLTASGFHPGTAQWNAAEVAYRNEAERLFERTQRPPETLTGPHATSGQPGPAAAYPNRSPGVGMQGPETNAEWMVNPTGRPLPQVEQANALRAQLQREDNPGQAYYSPAYQALREYDQRNQPASYRDPEAAYRDLTNHYREVQQQLATIADPRERAAARNAAYAANPATQNLPSLADFMSRNVPFQERMQQAVQDQFWTAHERLATPREKALDFQKDPVVSKVALGKGAITEQEVNYAANKLGIKLAPETVQADPFNQARQGPEMNAEWSVNRAAVPGQTVNLPQREAAIAAGAVAPGRPGTSTGTATAAAAPATGVPVAAGAPRAAGAGTREPFAGSTPAQQFGSAWGHYATLRDTQGRPAADKWAYDNYDRLAAVGQANGKPLTESRGAFGRGALSESIERPGAYAGFTLQQGNARFGAMRDALNRALTASRSNNFSGSTFARDWTKQFGEGLTRADLTVEGLQNKLDWVSANMQQAARYSRDHPQGQREVAQTQQARDVLSAAYEHSRQLAQRSQALSDRYQQLQQSKAHKPDFDKWRSDRDAIRTEREQVSREIEQAKQRIGDKAA